MQILFILLIIIFFLDKTIFCDAPEAWQVGLQDPATPVMEGMIFFHNILLDYLLIIGIFVFWVLASIIYFYTGSYVKGALIKHKFEVDTRKFTHASELEGIWTIIPAFVLLVIAVPSFTLLYSLDELMEPSLTVKIIGHQWYWSYEYSDFAHLKDGESLGFDSYMLNSDDLVLGSFRLLEVDNRVILPVDTHIRLLITSSDVLHSWAVPSFGVKVDACPGRLSQAFLFLKREGVYYGQCSEICGVNHGFMPIVVKAVSKTAFINWVLKKLEV